VARRLLLAALLVGSLGLPTSQVAAAGPPLIQATYVTDVTSTSANLRAEVSPQGQSTTYRFDYLTLAAYEANVKAGKDPFAGAAKAPLSGSASAGAGAVAVLLTQHLAGLSPQTLYRFRAVATNASATTTGPERGLGTQAPTNAFSLLDGRGWEMVSPVDKNGGAIQPPEGIFGGGAFQAAANGNSITYSSADSFAGGVGAPPGSQYIATRGGSGWSTQNITTPLLAGSYGQEPDGVPYRLFSEDLARGLLSNGQRCRTEPGECPVVNPPLPSSGAVPGYRAYYLRGGGAFASLITAADLTHTSMGPAQLEVGLAGATGDLGEVILTTCAALTANGTEAAAPGGCAAQNLYRWREGSLTAINLLPGETTTRPGAGLAAPSGAISADGNRVYFTRLEDGAIYLREGTETKLLPETVGGGATFGVASDDGRYAFFTKGGHLFRYDAVAQLATDLTPAGGVVGMLGASAEGASAYYQDGSGLQLWANGTTSEVAPGPEAAAPSDYPPGGATARVSADGAHLLFLSAKELTDYENVGQVELFLYGPAGLTCVSCNPTGERPEGAASIPGAIANGTTRIYKPRALSSSGNRAFFETTDDLVPQDSNHRRDVYEWEAQGEGNCGSEGGCIQLISSGRSLGAASFIDASADGDDAFFLTDASLAFGDPGSYDLYDARALGGFPPPPGAIPCEGDACQALPEAPEDPTPGTLVPNGGNPAPRFVKVGKKKHHKSKGKHHRAKRKHGKSKHGGRR
jgi:hypothetical protein